MTDETEVVDCLFPCDACRGRGTQTRVVHGDSIIGMIGTLVRSWECRECDGTGWDPGWALVARIETYHAEGGKPPMIDVNRMIEGLAS